jgi:hypothetical protein
MIPNAELQIVKQKLVLDSRKRASRQAKPSSCLFAGK